MDLTVSNALERSVRTLPGLSLIMKRMTFAKRLREARMAAKLTQQELADAIGVTNRAISAWEKGHAADVLAENLFAAADKLGVDPRWLATGEADKAKTAAQVADDLEALSPEKLEAIRQLVNSLKD